MQYGEQVFDNDKQRRQTRLALLRVLSKTDGDTRSGLSARLDVSKATVSAHVADLLDQGVCREVGAERSVRVGRRRILLKLNGPYRYILTLDLGLNEPLLVLADMEAKVLGRKTIDWPTGERYLDRLPHFYKNILAFVDELKVPRDRLGIFAMCAPGVVNEKDQSFFASGRYSDWQLDNLCKDLAKSFKVPWYLFNDVNAATWGEFLHDEGRDVNMLYLAGGSGIGAGMIVNSKLYTGSTGRAGEIGDLMVPVSNSGQDGVTYMTLGEKASLGALLKRLREEAPEETLKRLEQMKVDLYKVGPKDLGALLQSGDAFTIGLVNEMAEMLGLMVCNVLITMDAELVVIGGDFTPISAYLIPVVERMMKQHLGTEACLRGSELGAEAGSYGLLRLAIDQVLVNLAQTMPIRHTGHYVLVED